MALPEEVPLQHWRDSKIIGRWAFLKFIKLQIPFRLSKKKSHWRVQPGSGIYCALELLELRLQVRLEIFGIAQNLPSYRGDNSFTSYCSMMFNDSCNLYIHLHCYISLLPNFLGVACCSIFFSRSSPCLLKSLSCHFCSPEVASISGWS